MVDLRYTPHQPQPGAEWSRDVVATNDAIRAQAEKFLFSIVDGILLEDVVLTGGASTAVDHKLGRAYQGFIRVRSTVAADYPADVVRTDTDIRLTLDVTNTQTVSLWVF